MNPNDVRNRITDRTRLIIINTPQNPTGAVMTEQEVLEIASIAQEHDLYLLSDEVYAKIVYDKVHHSPSVTDHCKDRTIILNSLSKTYAMSGWRLGYAIGPERLIKKMGLLLQTIVSCQPAFLQYGGMNALLNSKSFLHDKVQILKKRRDVLVEGLNTLPGVSCTTPSGAFYAFANVMNTGMSGYEFAYKMLSDAGVCVSHGSCFGAFGEGYIRFCYASTPVDVIEQALDRMRKVLNVNNINAKVKKVLQHKLGALK
jgi:aspartate/methionine/tyrosine aminotransferase